MTDYINFLIKEPCIIKRAVFLRPSVRHSVTPFSNKIGKNRSENVNEKEMNIVWVVRNTKEYYVKRMR